MSSTAHRVSNERLPRLYRRKASRSMGSCGVWCTTCGKCSGRVMKSRVTCPPVLRCKGCQCECPSGQCLSRQRLAEALRANLSARDGHDHSWWRRHQLPHHSGIARPSRRFAIAASKSCLHLRYKRAACVICCPSPGQAGVSRAARKPSCILRILVTTS